MDPQLGRSRVLVLLALAAVMALSIFRATSVAAQSRRVAASPRSETSLNEGRRQVRMMDDIFKHAVLTTHKMYVQDAGTPAAVVWAKQVINQLHGAGWPEARIFATHDRPLNPENTPVDAFEKSAAAAFKQGKASYEQVSSRELRYATSIRLTDEKCLMCHVRNQKDDLVGGVSYRVLLTPTGK